MVRTRHYVGPPWPPLRGAYDYALSLCPSDLAWEFLRRSPSYQRDYRLNCKGVTPAPRCFRDAPRLTRIRRRTRRASDWGLSSFVDPAQSAPNSPVCWLSTAAAPLIDAVVNRAHNLNSECLSVRELAAVRHIVLGPTNEQYILLRDANTALTLRLHGSRALRAPVNTSILLQGLPSVAAISSALHILDGLALRPNYQSTGSRDLLLLRDALVALDGRCLGASYRELATTIYGEQAAKSAWSSGSRWMKDRMCRALKKGQQLRDGGYRKLLE